MNTAYDYDSLNRLVHVSGKQGASAVADYAYGLALDGQRTSVAELNGRVVNYAYDLLNQLTNETITGASSGGNGCMNYSYDPVGNRLSRNSSLPGILAANYSYDFNDRLNSDTYDANGNTRSSSMRDPQTQVSQPVSDQYNSENQLISRNGGQISVAYDGDGNRVRQTVVTATNTVTTYYLVDTLNPSGYPQVVEELTVDSANPDLSTPQVTWIGVWGHALLAQDRYLDGAWKASYYGYDGQGSVRYLTDAQGQVTDSFDFDAFGNLISREGNTANNYLYQGEQYDSDLRLYYLRARYADPDRGRFWTMDSFEGFGGDPLSLHKYTFNHNNPINRVDRSGHESYESANMMASLAPMARGALLALQQMMTSCNLQSAGAAAVVGGCFGGLASEAISAMVDAYTGKESTTMELIQAFVEGFDSGAEAGFAMALSPFTAAAYMGYSSVVAGLDFWRDWNNPNVPTWIKYMEGAVAVASLAPIMPAVATKLNNLLQTFCFPAGTLVSADSGPISIEEIKVGDMVWAQSDSTGEIGLKQVTQVFTNISTVLVVLHCGTNTLEATPEHPLWVVGQGWKAAGQIQVGDELWTRHGVGAKVAKIGGRNGRFSVYNFEVEDAHSYFAGNQLILVHNVCERWRFYQNKIESLYKQYESRGLEWVDANGSLHKSERKPIAGDMPAMHVVQEMPGDQLLGIRGLAPHWQVRHSLYSSERLNTRATHIQCCPGQPLGLVCCSPNRPC